MDSVELEFSVMSDGREVYRSNGIIKKFILSKCLKLFDLFWLLAHAKAYANYLSKWLKIGNKYPKEKREFLKIIIFYEKELELLWINLYF